MLPNFLRRGRLVYQVSFECHVEWNGLEEANNTTWCGMDLKKQTSRDCLKIIVSSKGCDTPGSLYWRHCRHECVLVASQITRVNQLGLHQHYQTPPPALSSWYRKHWKTPWWPRYLEWMPRGHPCSRWCLQKRSGARRYLRETVITTQKSSRKTQN